MLPSLITIYIEKLNVNLSVWIVIRILFFINSTNGFSTEDDSRPGHDQVCCLIDNNEKCQRQAGNASYSKRIQNQARKLKLTRDEMVSTFKS